VSPFLLFINIIHYTSKIYYKLDKNASGVFLVISMAVLVNIELFYTFVYVEKIFDRLD